MLSWQRKAEALQQELLSANLGAANRLAAVRVAAGRQAESARRAMAEAAEQLARALQEKTAAEVRPELVKPPFIRQTQQGLAAHTEGRDAPGDYRLADLSEHKQRSARQRSLCGLQALLRDRQLYRCSCKTRRPSAVQEKVGLGVGDRASECRKRQ